MKKVLIISAVLLAAAGCDTNNQPQQCACPDQGTYQQQGYQQQGGGEIDIDIDFGGKKHSYAPPKPGYNSFATPAAKPPTVYKPAAPAAKPATVYKPATSSRPASTTKSTHK